MQSYLRQGANQAVNATHDRWDVTHKHDIVGE